MENKDLNNNNNLININSLYKDIKDLAIDFTVF